VRKGVCGEGACKHDDKRTDIEEKENRKEEVQGFVKKPEK
jgi:hypothetical protein